jgi:hypothetical protein
MSFPRWSRRALAGISLLLACSHSEPFTNPDVGNDGPLDPAEPVRLTHNLGADLTPAAHPGGTTLLYAFTQPGTPGGDQCLALLPAGGGTRQEYCPTSAGSRDSTDRYEEPAWIDSTTLAVVRAAKLIGRARDDYLVLGTARAEDPVDVTARLRFPYVTPAGILHLYPTHVTSLGDGRVAYIAETQISYLPCGPCPEDWTHVGREIMIVDLAGSAPPTRVPGTDYPTGVSIGPNPGDLVFTLAGDTRAFRRAADGAVDVLHDFGDIARDVQWRAGRLAAIVGGDVFVLTSDLGELSQVDGGGRLEVVDVATGQPVLPEESELTARRPAFAPDARAVFVQAEADDLYRIEAP